VFVHLFLFENLWYPYYFLFEEPWLQLIKQIAKQIKDIFDVFRASFWKSLISSHCSVNNDQTGYIKNRFIGFNHRQIQDIIDFAESYNVEGAILILKRRLTHLNGHLSWQLTQNVLKLSR
jgi:hypothetical protein